MNSLQKKLTNFNLLIKNNFCTSHLVVSDSNNENIASIKLNVIGAISDVIEIDDDIFCINDAGFHQHQSKKHPFIFNDLFELIKIDRDFSQFLKISLRYEYLYRILGLFSCNNYVFVAFVFCNSDTITIEIHQFNNKLMFVKKRFHLSFMKGKSYNLPNINIYCDDTKVFCIDFKDIPIIINESNTTIGVAL